MNWSTHLTPESALMLHEERVARLQRSWGPLGLRAALRRLRTRRSDRYDLAA